MPGRTFAIIEAALMLLGSGARAQADRTTLYRDPEFRGPAVAVDRTNPNLRQSFEVYSIRIDGRPWELCPEPNFRGRCLTVRQSTSDLRRAYGWLRPLQSIRPAGGSGGGGSVGGQSLRGMAAEFYPAPRRGMSGWRPARGGVRPLPALPRQPTASAVMQYGGAPRTRRWRQRTAGPNSQMFSASARGTDR